jgi:hypothetical protein
MKPDFTKLTPLIEARTSWKPSGERNSERRAHDRAIGDESERIIAEVCMQHGLSVQKIVPCSFDGMAHPAGYYLREDPEDGDLFRDHFVAFDLLVSGTTSFVAEVKLKPYQGHGSGRFYPLDRKRLHWMKKAYGCASDLQHLFVILDTKRADAPAYGLFAAPVDQLLANKETYVIQHGFGQSNEDAYRIPVTEFRPLSHFLEQHNQSKDTAYATPQKPLPCIDAAA